MTDAATDEAARVLAEGPEKMTPQEKIDAIWPGSGPGCHDSTADRLRAIALAQANEIEQLHYEHPGGNAPELIHRITSEFNRMKREREALLREHEVGDSCGLSRTDTFFFKHAEWKAAHDEAARVLAEGAKK